MILEHSPVFRYGISSNKLFDYLYSARPIIFAVDTPNNLVEETQSGLTVQPRSPKALAEAVIRLFKMPPAERGEMGLHGRTYLKEHHDIRKVAHRMEQVLFDTVKKNNIDP